MRVFRRGVRDVTVPIPRHPVPLTLQNFGVLAVAFVPGSRRGFAVLALYLAEGAAGLPVFSPSILGGGIAQILGPTGGFLMAYPLVAFVAGWIYEKSSARSSHKFACGAFASLMAEVVLFAGGLSWLAVQTHSIAMAIRFGLYWFIFTEVIKVRWRPRLPAGGASVPRNPKIQFLPRARKLSPQSRKGESRKSKYNVYRFFSSS